MYVLIQLKDLYYYCDDFEYEPFIVKADTPDFEKKYQKLKSVCQNYEDFQEVVDFVHNNFEAIEFEKRIIEI